MHSFLQKFGRLLVIWLPLGWLGIFFMLPLVEMVNVSLSEARRAVPPYNPAFQIGKDGISFQPAVDNYLLIYEYWEDYLWPAVNSVRLAFFSTLYCLLFAYPMAWWIARSNKSLQHILLVLILMPFWTSSLLRMYALIGLLNPNGVINDFLIWAGITVTPIQMMQTDFSIYSGMILTYLPLMILPLYASLVRLDNSVLEAAADLGAKNWDIFRTIILPLSMPGVIAGCLLVFIPAVGEFVIPALLGGPEQLMLGKVIWTEFFRNRDWPVAAAIAIILIAIIILPIVYARYQDKESIS
ncbi:ABC transporter permease subunit [Alphaproteobacteria bacterium]|jgi:putrescine transport system permease protein|nr:ABC transporter permease subunit [Alphaproteobacteria bacterium]MDC0970498.1 ABC transporter permease subunit [Alphaproteobacteria bacterium]